MTAPRKVKITGERSIESKLRRLAYELEDDAARIRADHPDRQSLANAVESISRRLGQLARGLNP